MAEKTYSFNGQDYVVSGSDDLHQFIDTLQTELTATTEKLNNTPKLAEQLQLWEKAKPFFDGEIDYNQDPVVVMTHCLEKAGHNVKDVSPEVVKYLFNNMLQAPTPQTPENTTTTKTASKPNVPKSKGNTETTAEEMGTVWLQRRMTGDLVGKDNA